MRTMLPRFACALLDEPHLHGEPVETHVAPQPNMRVRSAALRPHHVSGPANSLAVDSCSPTLELPVAVYYCRVLAELLVWLGIAIGCVALVSIALSVALALVFRPAELWKLTACLRQTTLEGSAAEPRSRAPRQSSGFSSLVSYRCCG